MLLVIMALVVGIALSLTARSLSDIVLSRQETESSKAFRLAESGVEQALNELRQGSVPDNIALPGDGIFTGQVAVGEETSFGLKVKEGEMAHLNVAGYTGNLEIMWTKTSDTSENPAGCSPTSGGVAAAIEVIAYTSLGTASYAYYNPYNPSCSLANGFTASTAGSSGLRSRVATYSVPANATMVRIRPVYNEAMVRVTGSASLQTQLYLIQSKATGGDVKKEIEVKRGLDAPGSVFDYALFSGGAIEK